MATIVNLVHCPVVSSGNMCQDLAMRFSDCQQGLIMSSVLCVHVVSLLITILWWYIAVYVYLFIYNCVYRFSVITLSAAIAMAWL